MLFFRLDLVSRMTSSAYFSEWEPQGSPRTYALDNLFVSFCMSQMHSVLIYAGFFFFYIIYCMKTNLFSLLSDHPPTSHGFPGSPPYLGPLSTGIDGTRGWTFLFFTLSSLAVWSSVPLYTNPPCDLLFFSLYGLPGGTKYLYCFGILWVYIVNVGKWASTVGSSSLFVCPPLLFRF
jgi:hypothetical protein